MTEIDKLIEEEASNHWSNSFYKEAAEEAQSKNDMCQTSAMARKVSLASFKAGSNLIIHQNRWRKVEEELPECRDNDYQVLGLLKNGEHKTIWVIKDSIPQIEVFDYHGVTEWKPIS